MKYSRLAPALLGVAALVLLAVLAVFLLGTDGDDDEPRVLRLGVLLNQSETGDPDTQNAVRFAVEDLRALFPEDDAPFEIELDIRRTGLNPETAQAEMLALAEDGIRVVLGPESSAELEAIRSIADEHDMVVVSHCATASSLAIAGDGVYRMVPSDAHQGAEVARLAFNAGARTIVTIWRDDVWGEDMNASLRDAFIQLGGTADEGVPFDPAATSIPADVATLAAQVEQARAVAGDAVAVVFLGFGPEAPQILEEAARYETLRSVAWYGSEGSVLSREIIQSPEAARFAADTGFVHPMFADSDSPRAESVRTRIQDALDTESVHYCAMAAYDMVWIAGLSAALAGTDDTDTYEEVLQALANGYNGASGRIELDDAGDRAGAAYDLWAIRDTGEGFTWTRISATDD